MSNTCAVNFGRLSYELVENGVMVHLQVYSTPLDDDILLTGFDWHDASTMLVSQWHGSVALVDVRCRLEFVGCTLSNIIPLPTLQYLVLERCAVLLTKDIHFRIFGHTGVGESTVLTKRNIVPTLTSVI